MQNFYILYLIKPQLYANDFDDEILKTFLDSLDEHLVEWFAKKDILEYFLTYFNPKKIEQWNVYFNKSLIVDLRSRLT